MGDRWGDGWGAAGWGLCVLVLFALASHALLLAGLAVPVWLLPACLPAALPAVLLLRTQEPPPARTPRWVGLGIGLLAVAVLAPLVYGSLATPARSWDGFASWSWRAAHLTPPASLDQPFFTEPGLHAHSRAYPLLQPLLQGAVAALAGGGGMLLFPALYVLLVLLVRAACRRAGLGPGASWLAGLAVALTPMWISPVGGSVDSGCAELAVAVALAACAAGLLLGLPLLLGMGTLLLAMLKPEGLPYGLAVLAATGLLAGRREHLGASVGLGLGLALWLPLHHRVLHGPEAASSPWLFLAPVLLVALALGGKELLLALRVRGWGLAAAAAGAVALLAVSAWLWRHELARGPGILAATVGGGLVRLVEEGGAEPAFALQGALQHLVFVRRYGLVFLLVLALALLPRSLRPPCPSPALLALLAMGFVVCVAKLLLTPEDGLAMELRDRFARLLLPWTAAGWLLVGPWVLGGPEGLGTRQPVLPASSWGRPGGPPRQ